MLLLDLNQRPPGYGPQEQLARLCLSITYVGPVTWCSSLFRGGLFPIGSPRDEEVKEVVPWSLGEIGDKSAIPPLKEALGDNSLTMRASALRALEKLRAKEGLP